MNPNDLFGQNSFGQNSPFGHRPPQGDWKAFFRRFNRAPQPQGKTGAGRAVLTAALFVLQLCVQFYILLPAINIQSREFWVFAGENLVILAALTGVLCRGRLTVNLRRVCLAVVGVGLVAFGALSLLSSPILQSQRYASMMRDSIQPRQIEEYTPAIDNVPLLDKDSASRLANRALGNLVDEVSQYELYDSYQVTVEGAPVRVRSWRNRRRKC